MFIKCRLYRHGNNFFISLYISFQTHLDNHRICGWWTPAVAVFSWLGWHPEMTVVPSCSMLFSTVKSLIPVSKTMLKLLVIFMCYPNYNSMNLTLEGPCIVVCNIYTFQRDTQCCSTECLLMHRCQLYMFRTITDHPQELLFRCCMCRLWYVIRTALSDSSRWYNVWGRTFSAATFCILLQYIYIAYNSIFLYGMKIGKFLFWELVLLMWKVDLTACT